MTRINAHCPEDIIRAISARGATLSDALRESLARYLYLIERARAEIRNTFEPGELIVLARVSNGTLFQAHTLEGLTWNVEDAADDEVAECDRPALLTKLRGLTLTQHAALVDALERYWRAVPLSPGVDILRILD